MSTPATKHIEVEPEAVAVVHRITDRFIRLGKTTPSYQVKARLGPKRGVLEQLAAERIIQYCGDAYLPSLRAVMELEDPDVREICCTWTALVLKALKLLYSQDGEKYRTAQEVSEVTGRLAGVAQQPEAIRVGLLFALDFSGYTKGWTSNGDGMVASICVAEGVLDFDSFDNAWQREIHRRRSEAERAARGGEPTALPDNPADMDRLVGLYNRNRFESDLPKLLLSASRETPLGMVMFDLDKFKQVNDGRGHAEGDEVLKIVATCARTACSGRGTCYRWGGDEFAILLPNHNAQEAGALADRIRREIGRKAHAWRVTASLGAVCFTDSAEELQQLQKEADEAMYKAKKAGGNKVCILTGTEFRILRPPHRRI